MSTDRVRVIRLRAKRQGLTLQIRGTNAALLDNGRLVQTGTLDQIDAWLIARDVHKPTGPKPTAPPACWVRWIDMFVAEQNAAQRRRATIDTRVAHLTTFARLTNPDPLTVTRDDLVTYLGANAWKPRTAYAVRSTFRVFFALLQALGHRQDNPAATLPTIRLPRSRPRPCPDHVVRQAYAAINDDRLRLALRIAVETGMRRAEVAAMQTSDVEGRPGDYTLHVTGKGGHERVIPITDELAGDVLRVPTLYVFPNQRGGGHLTPRWLGRQIAAALPGIWTVHTLRHRFATMAYQQNNDIRAVQELLGHTSPVTTAIYTKVSDQAMRTAASGAYIQTEGD